MSAVEVTVTHDRTGGYTVCCSHCADIAWRENVLDARTVADRHLATHQISRGHLQAVA